jgi:hypothetical protein
LHSHTKSRLHLDSLNRALASRQRKQFDSNQEARPTKNRISGSCSTAILLIAVFLLCLSAPLSAIDLPKYRIEPEGFNAPEESIRAVLDSCLKEIWPHFKGHDIEPFVVVRGHADPAVHYKRNERGEIVMELNTGGYYWAQYSYQFAHEFCHILSGFRDGNTTTRWFEETICEMASLFVLQRMSETWLLDPPYENWRDFAPELKKYSLKMQLERYASLRENKNHGLAAFYKKHQKTLANNPMNRELNGAMALELLPLFKENPESWESIRWLNTAPLPESTSFEATLRAWQSVAPERHKTLIANIASRFGIPLH